MSRPGNVLGLMIGSVRRVAVAGVSMDAAKTNLPAAAGCRSPARTFLMPRLVGPAVRPGELATDLATSARPLVGPDSSPICGCYYNKLLNDKCVYLTTRPVDSSISLLIPCWTP